jgi:hypothetical protein
MRMQAIWSALLVSVVCCAVAAAPYFAFRDDLFARLLSDQTREQTQISYDDEIADLRAQIDRMSRLDQERVKEIKLLVQHQATLEQVISGIAKDLLIQARNGLPASAMINSTPVPSPIEMTPAIPRVRSTKQAEQAATDDKKARRTEQKQARVARKRTQEAPTVAPDFNASRPLD